LLVVQDFFNPGSHWMLVFFKPDGSFFQTRKLGGVFSNQVVAFPKQKSNYKAVGSCLKL
jgi:hypothetical protein